MYTCYKQVYVVFSSGEVMATNLQYTTAQQLYSCLFECKIMCLVPVQDNAQMLYFTNQNFKLSCTSFIRGVTTFFYVHFLKVCFSLETPLIKNNESIMLISIKKILQLQHSHIQQVVRAVVGLYGVATVIVICLAQRWISIFHPSLSFSIFSQMETARWISIFQKMGFKKL